MLTTKTKPNQKGKEVAKMNLTPDLEQKGHDNKNSIATRLPNQSPTQEPKLSLR